MSFDSSLLTDVFSSIFYRRPNNVKLSGSGRVNVAAGSHENITIQGEYLEGSCSLYPNNNRLTIQDIQQYGELNNTNITAVINASKGNDLNGIGLYGYVAGQENNATAKYEILNCIDIQDYTPYIYDFTTSILDLRYPESIKFSVNANEDVKSVILNGKETTLREFVYTYLGPGTYQASIQGKSASGELSNVVTKSVTVPIRPYLNGIYIDKNPNSTWQQQLQCSISSIVYDRSPVTGYTIPYANVYFNSSARLRLSMDYNAGGLGAPLAGFTKKPTPTYVNGVTYSVISDSNPNLMYVDGYNSSYLYPYGLTQVILLLYPYNSYGTQGYLFEIGFNLYAIHPSYALIADASALPPAIRGATQTTYGNIMPQLNVSAVIVPSSYGVIRDNIAATETVTAVITGMR